MRSFLPVQFVALLLLTLGVAALPASADNDKDDGKEHVRAAPAPDLGTGILGCLVIGAGFVFAARRFR